MTEDETRVLSNAKKSNPWYFRALIRAADVMLDRRIKYSGDVDPYTNFRTVALMMGMAVMEVFPFYISLKHARIKVNQEDFADESFIDTLRDLANYALLWVGWIIRTSDGNETEENKDRQEETNSVSTNWGK